jgi:hypothetical protein
MSTSSGLIERIKGIILKPDVEWAVIDAEPATVASLYQGYILILAAIGPVAGFLHGVLFGYSVAGFSYRPSFMGALSSAVVQYVLGLVMVFIVALIIDALAPTFQGQKSQIQALKLVAYSSTASWLCGIFSLIPGLGFLGILGLYSIWLFWRGLPVMMKSPPEKSLAYTAVIIVIGIIASVIISPVALWLTGETGGMGQYSSTDDGKLGSFKLPGGGEVNLDKLQQAAKVMEEQTKAAEAGASMTGPAMTGGSMTGGTMSGGHNPGAASNASASGAPAGIVSTDTLKGFLPASLSGGLDRTELSSVGGQVAGFGGSTVEAKYGGNGRELTLTVTDLGAIGAFASLGGALGISGDKETPTSYSKLSQEDGNTVAEEYDRQSHSGSYGLILASRFMVRAEGSSISMDDLRKAVKTVDLAKLQALAK